MSTLLVIWSVDPHGALRLYPLLMCFLLIIFVDGLLASGKSRIDDQLVVDTAHFFSFSLAQFCPYGSSITRYVNRFPGSSPHLNLSFNHLPFYCAMLCTTMTACSEWYLRSSDNPSHRHCTR
jgi:hypothetical protein